MPDTQRTNDERADLGEDIFARKVQPTLRPEDDGKFVAIDIDSGEYVLNEDDYTAVKTLRTRKPSADIWLLRAGDPATYRIGAGR